MKVIGLMSGIAGLGIAAALAAPSVGCKNADSVTGVQQGFSPTPKPPPAFNLAGTWTGTVTAQGAGDPYLCERQAMPVTVQLEQSGGIVRFSFPGCPCSPSMELTNFDGTLTGTDLSGGLARTFPYKDDYCRLSGSASGSTESSHVTLKGSLAGRCNQLNVEIDLRR